MKKSYYILAGVIAAILLCFSIIFPCLQNPILIFVNSLTLLVLMVYTYFTGQMTVANQEILLNELTPVASCDMPAPVDVSDYDPIIELRNHSKFNIECSLFVEIQMDNAKTGKFESLGTVSKHYQIQPFAKLEEILYLKQHIDVERNKRGDSFEPKLSGGNPIIIKYWIEYRKFGSKTNLIKNAISIYRVWEAQKAFLLCK